MSALWPSLNSDEGDLFSIRKGIKHTWITFLLLQLIRPLIFPILPYPHSTLTPSYSLLQLICPHPLWIHSNSSAHIHSGSTPTHPPISTLPYLSASTNSIFPILPYPPSTLTPSYSLLQLHHPLTHPSQLLAVPSAPENLVFKAETFETLTISWSPPQRLNGIILSYEISYKELKVCH